MQAKPKATFALLRDLFRQVDFKPSSLILPAILSLCAAALEGVSVMLLVPVLKGSGKLNFGFLAQSPRFQALNRFLPALFPTDNATIFILLLIFIFSATVIRVSLSYAGVVLTAHKTRDLVDRLRNLLFSRGIGYGKLFFDRENSGHLQHVMVGVPETLGSQFSSMYQTLTWSFMLLVYLPLMFWLSWKITLSVLLIAPAMHYALQPLIAKVREASKQRSEARKRLSGYTSNILTGILLVKAYASEDAEARRFDAVNRQVSELELRLTMISGLLGPIQEMVFPVTMLLLLFAVPFSTNAKTGFAPSLLVYVYLLKRASTALPVISRFNASLASMHGQLKDVTELLDEADKSRVPEGKNAFPGLREGIEFKRLSYAFPNGAKVLDDVTFSIPKGKMTAIVGPSGSGKTTLLNLILRFYDPPAGGILLDGADIRNFSIGSQMAKMALIGQDTLLFNDSIRRNVSYSLNGAASESAVAEALKKAELFDLVARLPQGLDTMIGDRGIRLSGGEKQRLSIARAILKGADILLLDEATSSLDSQTEALIEKSIHTLVQGKTSIVVAHRLSTIRNADKIVVIEGGRLVEQGSRQELLDLKGRFFSFWNAQKFD